MTLVQNSSSKSAASFGLQQPDSLVLSTKRYCCTAVCCSVKKTWQGSPEVYILCRATKKDPVPSVIYSTLLPSACDACTL